MDQEAKTRLASNVAGLPKMFSAWAMTLAGVLGTIWFSLPADQQLELFKHSPLPMWSYPIAMTVLGIVGRVWPQKSFNPPTNQPTA
jgi:hypothetical protein